LSILTVELLSADTRSTQSSILSQILPLKYKQQSSIQEHQAVSLGFPLESR